jgi:hypothetical protein
MSIEQQLSELTAAIKALATAVAGAAGGAGVATATQQKPEPEKKKTPEKSPETGGGATLSPGQVSDAAALIQKANPLVSQIIAAGKRDSVVALLEKFGAKKTSGVPVDKLPAFLDELKTLHTAATAVGEASGDEEGLV